MVCNQATGLPAIPVLQLSGQVLVANHGCKFYFLPFYASHSHANNHAKKCSQEVFPPLAYCFGSVEFVSRKVWGRPEVSA